MGVRMAPTRLIRIDLRGRRGECDTLFYFLVRHLLLLAPCRPLGPRSLGPRGDGAAARGQVAHALWSSVVVCGGSYKCSVTVVVHFGELGGCDLAQLENREVDRAPRA